MDEFSKLLEQQIPRLRRYAFALHRSNKSRADDLVQDTLVRAIAKQNLWKPGTNLLGWLFTLMHNQNVNDVRRSVAREGFGCAIGEFHDTVASVNDTPSSFYCATWTARWPSCTSSSARSSYWSPSKACPMRRSLRLVGIPIGTVRSRLSRGRMMLRQLMDTGHRTAPAKGARDDRAVPLAAQSGIALA